MSFEEKILSIVTDLSQNSGGGISGNNFTDIKTETLNMKTASASTPTTTISIDDNMDVMFKKSNDSSPVNIIAKNVKEDNETRLAAVEAKVSSGSGGSGSVTQKFDDVKLSTTKAFVIGEFVEGNSVREVKLYVYKSNGSFNVYFDGVQLTNGANKYVMVNNIFISTLSPNDLYLGTVKSGGKSYLALYYNGAEETFSIIALTSVSGNAITFDSKDDNVHYLVNDTKFGLDEEGNAIKLGRDGTRQEFFDTLGAREIYIGATKSTDTMTGTKLIRNSGNVEVKASMMGNPCIIAANVKADNETRLAALESA